jgi:pimeloyl-ACP methyl ester carboxylesterase
MGLYDDPANISEIIARTGEDKIQYIGYSQGTAQMFYALTHDDENFYGQHLHRTIMLAPVFYP